MSTSNERVIKRYSNRKLYDTKHSCYITLEALASLMKEGNIIKCVESRKNSEGVKELVDVTGEVLLNASFTDKDFRATLKRFLLKNQESNKLKEAVTLLENTGSQQITNGGYNGTVK